MDEKTLLKELGLTDYEAQIVLTLLVLGSTKVGTISKNCSVPKNKIYESLRTLLKKGIVREVPSIPKKYFIKEFSDLEILLKQKEEEVKKLNDNFKRLKSNLAKKNNQTVTEPIGIVYGQDAFLLKLKEALSRVSKENLILMKKVRTDSTVFRLTSEAIIRGASIKVLTPIENRGKLKDWLKIGVRVRYLEKFSEMAFSTFDDKTCRLNLGLNDTFSDPTIWIDNRSFINLLREKFKDLWRSAID